MQSDLRGTAIFSEIRSLSLASAGAMFDVCDLHCVGDRLSCTASVVCADGAARSVICVCDTSGDGFRAITDPAHDGKHGRVSPDGACLAYLSDRDGRGDQLYLVDLATGAGRAAPVAEGWVEYLHWSPAGGHILLGVAAHGADVASGQGATASRAQDTALPDWMPSVDHGDDVEGWRSVWIYDLASGSLDRASPERVTVWEADWCGDAAWAGSISDRPSEGAWYGASLAVFARAGGLIRRFPAPTRQLGLIVGSPDGKRIAYVEALCSDRGIIAGDLRFADVATGTVRAVETDGVDVTSLEWRSDRRLLIAGHRGAETVTAHLDLAGETLTVAWSETERSTAGRYATIAGIEGGFALVGESFAHGPELAVVRDGQYQTIKRFAPGYAESAPIGAVEQRRWRSSDGLEIHGWLVRPKSPGPHPLIVNVHGGPVWQWRPHCLARSQPAMLALLRRGCALFFPNPRGSGGRGQPFAERVLGDIGGMDAQDVLTGIDALTGDGTIDATRIGLIGNSYGGFLTSWLITQDSRFAAAVSMAAHNNQLSQRLLSNIPEFIDLFCGGEYLDPTSAFFDRSPVLRARQVRTPVLHVAGARDRCTPAEEALQFHRAISDAGGVSTLVTYPLEGHGIRKTAAALDLGARVVTWFETHLDLATTVSCEMGADR